MLSWPAAVNILVAFNAGNIAGRFAPSLLLRHLLPPGVAAVAAVLGGVLVLVGTTTKYTGFLVVMAFYGACVGVIQSLYAINAVWFCGERGRSKRMDVVVQATGLACLAGPPLGGWVIQGVGMGYFELEWMAGGMVVFGGGLLLVAAIAKGRVATTMV